jgi:hypothetical protein
MCLAALAVFAAPAVRSQPSQRSDSRTPCQDGESHDTLAGTIPGTGINPVFWGNSTGTPDTRSVFCLAPNRRQRRHVGPRAAPAALPPLVEEAAWPGSNRRPRRWSGRQSAVRTQRLYAAGTVVLRCSCSTSNGLRSRPRSGKRSARFSLRRSKTNRSVPEAIGSRTVRLGASRRMGSNPRCGCAGPSGRCRKSPQIEGRIPGDRPLWPGSPGNPSPINPGWPRSSCRL